MNFWTPDIKLCTKANGCHVPQVGLERGLKLAWIGMGWRRLPRSRLGEGDLLKLQVWKRLLSASPPSWVPGNKEECSKEHQGIARAFLDESKDPLSTGDITCVELGQMYLPFPGYAQSLSCEHGTPVQLGFW